MRHARALASDSAYRKSEGLYLGDGMKLLKEAVAAAEKPSFVLWRGESQRLDGLCATQEYVLTPELFDYVSPMKNSPGPLFAVQLKVGEEDFAITNAIILESVQDPGNVGTIIRTANAFNIDAVILTGACADLYNPKTVRATMGAIFRQRVMQMDLVGLSSLLQRNGLKLYGAALTESARDLREIELSDAAVAVGSEGSGLSEQLLSICDGQLIIPMQPDSESLNAAVAASVLMWEIYK